MADTTTSHTDGTRTLLRGIGGTMISKKKAERTPKIISRDLYESLMKTAELLDAALSALDNGQRYGVMRTLLEARLMALKVKVDDAE